MISQFQQVGKSQQFVIIPVAREVRLDLHHAWPD